MLSPVNFSHFHRHCIPPGGRNDGSIFTLIDVPESIKRRRGHIAAPDHNIKGDGVK